MLKTTDNLHETVSDCLQPSFINTMIVFIFGLFYFYNLHISKQHLQH